MKPVASPASSIRSAARGTYSAYKRQPIRWRLAGGSAALTLVILLGFAVIVGTLTTQAIYKDFNRQVSSAADRLQNQLYYQYVGNADGTGKPQYKFGVDLDAFASTNNAAIRVVTGSGVRFDELQGRAELRAAARDQRRGQRLEGRDARDPGVCRATRRSTTCASSHSTRARSPTSGPPPTACGSSSASACSAAPRWRCSPGWPPRAVRWSRSRS